MKTEMPDLPEEIIFDVLSRLPVVSFCRFRCVSKSWRSLISHPSFIKTHVNRNTNTNKYERLVLSDQSNFYTLELDSSQFRYQSLAVRLNFPLGQNPIDCAEICYSCDGLVLMLDERFHCCLVNPSTREFRKLPLSPFTSKPVFTDYGFGYDSSIDDYEVVNICYYNGEANAGCADNVDYVVSVYTLKTNFWRRIANSPYDHSCFGHQSGAFVCGALHWVASNGTDDVIVVLVLADEKFQTVPSPTPVCIGDILCVLGGCLSLWVLDHFHPYCLDFWVMKEYGVKDSWMKFTVTYDNIYDSWRPLSLSRTSQVLLYAEAKNLVLLDPQEEESDLVVQGLPTQFEVGTYVESLVSPQRQCL